MCEISATLAGCVLEIDMYTMVVEKTKTEFGMRDMNKILPFIEVTANDLMIYRINTELYVVAEQCWFSEFKRPSANDEVNEDEGLDRGVRNKHKDHGVIEVVALGSLSLH